MTDLPIYNAYYLLSTWAGHVAYKKIQSECCKEHEWNSKQSYRVDNAVITTPNLSISNIDTSMLT
jgi:hypothetical protein